MVCIARIAFGDPGTGNPGTLVGVNATAKVVDHERRNTVRGLGRAVFIAILLLIAGTLSIIYGIAAIADANFWVNEKHFAFANLHTWGWITVIIGALGSLLAVGGAYPFWSLGVFAICLWIIHGLVVLGEPIEEEKRLPGSSDPGAGGPSRLSETRSFESSRRDARVGALPLTTAPRCSRTQAAGSSEQPPDELALPPPGSHQ